MTEGGLNTSRSKLTATLDITFLPYFTLMRVKDNFSMSLQPVIMVRPIISGLASADRVKQYLIFTQNV